LAERKKRGFEPMANSMFPSANRPNDLRVKALLIACYIHNRIPSGKRKVFSYEMCKGRKPKLGYLEV